MPSSQIGRGIRRARVVEHSGGRKTEGPKQRRIPFSTAPGRTRTLEFVLAGLTQHLRQQACLSERQAADAVSALLDEQVPVQAKAEFLTALSAKGETVEEIGFFARELRARCIRPPIDEALRAEVILDVCGTGGDRLNTFNISTTVALVVASAGIAVAKHGNRAVTSQSGSADVLEALGVPIDLSPEQAARSLRDHHFAFLFAPKYHPSFKHIAPARKLCAQRGQRTVFNFLGPLLNPAQPNAQLVGVPAATLCEPIALVLQSLGVRRGMVVSGRVQENWLDELSIWGENMIAEFYHARGFNAGLRLLHGFPFQKACLRDLAGGDRDANAEVVRRLLHNQEHGPKRDAVLLNAGAALCVAGKTRSILDGWELASDLLDSGKAGQKLRELQDSPAPH
jgi:anthranilate phosphoribosyltransferase